MKAVLKVACVALLTSVFGAAAGAQQASLINQRTAPLRMKQVDHEHMPAADRAVFDAAGGRLARAARIFGYQMQEPGWSCDEVLTPDTPDYLMMVCRRPKADGRGTSVFSAMIARRGDAVYVVPVMYGGAAPWKRAANMKMSREIFNHVVSPGIAAKEVQPGGDWMTLALTFTALAGDDSVVLAVPSSKLQWLLAPEPTIMYGNGSSKRTVMFSDVSAADGVRIWTLSFNKRGRLTAARVKVRPDLKPQVVSTASPKWRMLKNLPSPVKNVTPTPAVQH